MFPLESIILIDKRRKVPVYQQIVYAIAAAIRNGVLTPGAGLPGSRELAGVLGVHRKTVIAAYDELHAQDWIQIVPRKRVWVSETIPLLKPRKWNHTPRIASYAHSFALPFRMVTPVTKAGVADVPQMIIDDGHPDVRLSPIDELLKTYRSYTSRTFAIRNAHSGTEQGTLQLREELARYLSETRGLNSAAENLLITHGAQMGIYLAARLLLYPKAAVIAGAPNYPVANGTFKEAKARLVEVAVDEQGIDTDAIEAICMKRKVVAVYAIPHHHYPTTVTLSPARRMKLLELSKRFGFAIIEDDYDYDYHYTSSPYLPLASGEHAGNVIYIGSFSKILDPSLRIGFMVAPRNFIEQCKALRTLIDVGGDGYMQNALAALIKSGELKRHLKKAKKIYHQRRDFLDQLLKEHLGTVLSYTLPSGGMAIWIRLLPEYPVNRLEAITQLKILRIDTVQNAFRFGFASMNEKELETAVHVLKESLSRLYNP
ncbi:PLP-dependent aminotransferase family protein [Niabella sp. CC-SYL272]|uniref:aminotransferase-like domain-containing protein n=1 Tax=Niabella agricola TaxID=2891571 RepID=UPI001F30F5F0|nr:PLP-dependent aminotransferase family protein [Niabella agricola]MCF3107597.1 PLP-dependent aminotransferase family protein [Niabella agricola]